MKRVPIYARLCICLSLILMILFFYLLNCKNEYDEPESQIESQAIHIPSSSEPPAQETITRLLEPLYFTMEYATQFPFLEYNKDILQNEKWVYAPMKGTFQAGRFFLLYDNVFSSLSQDLESVLKGESTLYDQIVNAPDAHRAMAAVIVKPDEETDDIVTFDGDSEISMDGVVHYLASRYCFDPSIPTDTLEALLKSFSIEAQLEDSKLDLSKTKVLLLRKLHPLTYNLTFLFSDGTNEYILTIRDSHYSPYDFYLFEYLLPGEASEFTLEAGKLYDVHNEILPFVLQEFEIDKKLQEREAAAYAKE